jgi:Domain of unknown function (DUF4037)
MMPQFIRGLELNRLFYTEEIRPLLEAHFPDLSYAAATIGTGSEVLGFDTEMSRDHDWGPGVVLFAGDNDVTLAESIKRLLGQQLPKMFYGYPTCFELSPDDSKTLVPSSSNNATHHRVFVTTVKRFVHHHLNFDLAQPITSADWLTFPSQRLLELTSGAVYHDGVGELTEVRRTFNWYPHDVWLYLLAAGWQRIGQEQPLMSRAGFVGDELGSGIIGSRLVHDIMSLSFLIEKKYAPYPKWFGSAFSKLESARVLLPILQKVQHSKIWQEREVALNEACECLAHACNTLNIPAVLPEQASSFHNRPFNVINGERLATLILKEIKDQAVKQLTKKPLIGNIDQWSDNTDLRASPVWRISMLDFYQ